MWITCELYLWSQFHWFVDSQWIVPVICGETPMTTSELTHFNESRRRNSCNSTTWWTDDSKITLIMKTYDCTSSYLLCFENYLTFLILHSNFKLLNFSKTMCSNAITCYKHKGVLIGCIERFEAGECIWITSAARFDWIVIFLQFWLMHTLFL